MARTHGGSHVDTPTTRPHGGDDQSGGGRPRTHGGNVSNVAGGEAAVADAFSAGQVRSAGTASTGGAQPPGTTQSPVTSTITGEPLPPGYKYDANEALHGPDGGFAKDPTAPPDAHNRDSEYPGGFRESTHHEMARRYTLEGAAAGEWPRGPDGKRVPREDLTWVDENGVVIEVPAGDVITYGHQRPVVQDWNDNGRFNPRADRNEWYNNVDNLRPQLRSENSSEGATLGIRYKQETGGNYTVD
ncbi:hypothetical protein [Actinoplanes sp. NPDC049118]|uniref:hypothetical protein n=1 Tax=Actinoplanes sp. NPDC049118 TaxID=3155769 RepID=UPI0033E71186